MTATPTSALGFQNFFSATLTGDITASSTDILMDAIPNATEGFLVIEPDSTTAREVIFYTSKTALKVVCPSAADGRGQDDTSASAHSTGATVIMAPVAGFWEAFQSGRAFTNQVINTIKLNKASEFIYDHVASGIVITGDSLGVNKNYSISSGVVYIGGERCTVAAVSAQTVGASKDRYIDLRSNGDGTASYITNEVNNNAASQALVAGDLRVGIVVAGATTIANAASINQGEFDKVLPIASSIPYAFTDSIGNIICNRDPQQRILGYRQILTNATSTGTSDMTGLNTTILVPASAKVKVSGFIGAGSASVASNGVYMGLLDVTAGVTLCSAGNATNASGDVVSCCPSRVYSIAAGSRNFKAQISRGANAATANSNGSATNPNYILIERAT